ncbi:hypothetical protein N665_0049s0006 [Sinapis alba]|nr:hypothetical protein N665_0049s0006 [Sinapis alba]
MEELGLPSRLFKTGFEPTGRKRVNIYFNLRWIELIKKVLDNDQLDLLNESHSGNLLKMGSHTFSVMFLHYILSRQLVTAKDYELWWLLVGKPIHFALVTGLNCEAHGASHSLDKEKSAVRVKGNVKGKASTSTPSILDSLFRGEEKPTAGWIMNRLIMGKKYKDPFTRLRLSLLVLVEDILCPTCGKMKIRPEVVSMLGNLDEFLKYPWVRTQACSDVHYVQDTMAIQGFAHVMILVTLTVCPSIIVKDGAVDPLLGMYSTNSEEIVMSIVDRKPLRSLVCTGEYGERLYRGLADNEDESVDNLVSLIGDNYPFEHKTWSDGVKADEVELKKGPNLTAESTHLDTKVSGLQREIKAAIAATRELDVKVTTEFDDIRKPIAGFGQPEYVHPQGSYSALETPAADPSCGRGKQPGGGETGGEEVVGEHPESMTAAHGTEEIGEPVGTSIGMQPLPASSVVVKFNLETNFPKRTNFKKKSQGACWGCGKSGQRAKDCRHRKNGPTVGDVNKANLVENHFVVVVSETYIMTNYIDWWIDIGATKHVCSDVSMFVTYEQGFSGEKLYMGSASAATIEGKGKVILKLTSGKEITLTNVLHVPEIRKNLISCSLLSNKGFKTIFESDKVVLTKGGMYVGKGYSYIAL